MSWIFYPLSYLTITKYQLNILGISTVGINGDQAGYTIVNFVVLYIIGAAMNKWNFFAWKKRYDMIGYVLCSLMIWFGRDKMLTSWDYSNILVMISSILFFNIFRKWKVELGGVQYVSKYCFGVYLIHTKALIQEDFWNLFHIQKYCQLGGIYMLGNYIFCVLATFMLCIVVDSLCHLFMEPIIRVVNKFGSRLIL